MIDAIKMGAAKITQTTPNSSVGWLTSGTIPCTFTFNSGKGLTIDLEFRDAQSESQAQRQVANALQALGTAMQELARQHM